jgi:hypothetical protein
MMHSEYTAFGVVSVSSGYHVRSQGLSTLQLVRISADQLAGRGDRYFRMSPDHLRKAIRGSHCS